MKWNWKVQDNDKPLFAVLRTMAALLSFLVLSIPQSSASSASQKTEYHGPLSNFWDWVTKDSISFFTFVLAIATAALVYTSIRQIGFLKRAEATSEKLAEVSERQMLITGHQTDILEKQKEIMRQEFLVTHRPTLEVRFVHQVSEGIEITVINTGTGVARFVEARGGIWHVLPGESFPTPHDLTEKMRFSLRDTFQPSGADRCTISDTADAFNAGFGGSAHLFGWIVYETEGLAPVRRTTFFGRKVEPLQPELIPVEGTDWNFIQ